MPFRYCRGGASGRQAHTGSAHAEAAPEWQFLFLLRHFARRELPRMNSRPATALVWSAIGVLALAALFLLLRNSVAIPSLVALDPNEGWNAAHTIALMTGHSLYPAGLMVNNYPPLSFYAVAALATLTGDAVIAGRLLSLLSFLATCALIAAITRRMGAGLPGMLTAVVFFAAVLLIASDYVGMDDPQLLGHALQL